MSPFQEKMGNLVSSAESVPVVLIRLRLETSVSFSV